MKRCLTDLFTAIVDVSRKTGKEARINLKGFEATILELTQRRSPFNTRALGWTTRSTVSASRCMLRLVNITGTGRMETWGAPRRRWRKTVKWAQVSSKAGDYRSPHWERAPAEGTQDAGRTWHEHHDGQQSTGHKASSRRRAPNPVYNRQARNRAEAAPGPVVQPLPSSPGITTGAQEPAASLISNAASAGHIARTSTSTTQFIHSSQAHGKEPDAAPDPRTSLLASLHARTPTPASNSLHVPYYPSLLHHSRNVHSSQLPTTSPAI